MPLKPRASIAGLILEIIDETIVGIAWAPGAEISNAAIAGIVTVVWS
jgi:hypothetical protein